MLPRRAAALVAVAAVLLASASVVRAAAAPGLSNFCTVPANQPGLACATQTSCPVSPDLFATICFRATSPAAGGGRAGPFLLSL